MGVWLQVGFVLGRREGMIRLTVVAKTGVCAKCHRKLKLKWLILGCMNFTSIRKMK